MARTPSSSGMYRGSRVNREQLLPNHLVPDRQESAHEKCPLTDVRGYIAGAKSLVGGGDLVGLGDLQFGIQNGLDGV